MDSLRSFLEAMTNTVNEHARILAILQEETLKRVNDTQVSSRLT